MRTRPLMSLRLSTAPTQNIGAGPHGTRITFPITGGSFEGDRLRGKVLPGGDDWAVTRSDGILELDLRVTLETDDGALIHMGSTWAREVSFTTAHSHVDFAGDRWKRCLSRNSLTDTLSGAAGVSASVSIARK